MARSYAKKALALAETSNSENAFAQAYLTMGVAYTIYNDDSSVIYTSKSLQIADKIKLEKIRACALYNLAVLYTEASNKKEAAVFFDSVVTISRRNGFYVLLSNVYNAYGNLKFDIADNSGASIMYDSAYNVASRYSLSKQIGVALASQSKFATDQQDCERKRKEAIMYLKKQPGSEEEIATILNNLGMRSTNPDTALLYYHDALRITNPTFSNEIRIALFNNQAYSYLEKNDLKNAEGYLVSDAIPLAVKSGNYDWLANLYDTYTDILTAAKRTDEALKYARLAYQNKIKADQKKGLDQVRLLVALLDVKNKELKIETNDKQIREKESRIRLIIVLFSISLLILTIVIFFFNWRLQRNQVRYHAAMLKSAKKIIEAEDRERTKIGKDFHDLTGQKFSGLTSYLENQKFPEQATKNIALKMLEEIRQAVREMSHRMNRAWVERFTLEESISGLCSDCIKMASLNLEFRAPENYPEMNRETKIHLFRIVQEMLANAMQHARSSKITLEISFDSNQLFLRYNDNGPGFDKKSLTSQGSGLDNIIERVTILAGNVELDTRPGFGTDYSITIPLNREKLYPTENDGKS